MQPCSQKENLKVVAGDIRTAINNLQLCIDVNNKFVDATPLYSSSLVEPYHCLGKLLHAKRFARPIFFFQRQLQEFESCKNRPGINFFMQSELIKDSNLQKAS